MTRVESSFRQDAETSRFGDLRYPEGETAPQVIRLLVPDFGIKLPQTRHK